MQATPESRQITLTGRTLLSPAMMRLRFSGDFRDYPITRGRHVKLMMPLQPGHGQGQGVVKRIYTLRHIDLQQGWLDIDFVLHSPDGPASWFARHAEPGSTLEMIGPKGRLDLDGETRLFAVADASALPACALLLESLPATTTGQVLISVPSAADIQPLAHPDGIELAWLCDDRPDALLQAACAIPVCHWQDAFLWAAAESGMIRRLREHFARHGRPGRERTRVMGYWKAGISETDYHEERHREMDEP